MMFSATQTQKTEALTKLALKKQPVYIGVDDTKESATVEGLEQGKIRIFHILFDKIWETEFIWVIVWFVFNQVTLFVLRRNDFCYFSRF